MPRAIPVLFANLLIAVGLTLMFQQKAYGYTDPGTGLLAIQAAGSAFVAAGWYLRRKIYSFFQRGSKTKTPPQKYADANEGQGTSRQ
jgi:hypothetical protein